MAKIKRFYEPVPQEVKENVKKYLEKNNLGELLDVMRHSDHPDDNYLYHVIARKPNVNKYFHNGDWNYSMWTCWNEDVQSLNYGHYDLESEEDARELHKKFFYRISGQNVID